MTRSYAFLGLGVAVLIVLPYVGDNYLVRTATFICLFTAKTEPVFLQDLPR